MERPFVICHILASLDGRIDGAFFGAPETVPALQAYAELRSQYECQAIVYGTTTMLDGYADGKVGPLPAYLDTDSSLPLTDWVCAAGCTVGSYIVSVDPWGELAFSSPIIQRSGRPDAHIIEVLTEAVSPAYLAYLQAQGISYLFAGRDRLDCALLAHKLHALFGVDRLMAAGGGILNASFLQAGLLDELSLVVAPVADGGNGAGLFGQAAFLPKTIPTAFHLTDVKRLPGDVLWLRYCRS